MKILVLNYEYPPLGGGAGVITQQISEGLANLGHQITIVTTWFENLPETEKKNNLTIIRLKSKRKHNSPSNVFEMLSWITISKKFLIKFCSDKNFDVCFSNFSIPGGEVAFLLKKKFNIPYTVISHGHDIPWFFAKEMFWYHLVTYFRIKKICKNSVYNFMLNEDMKKNADSFLGKNFGDKNIIIPNGCDIDFFKPDISKKASVFKIVFAGRLVKQKDPLTFLNALNLLAKKGVPFHASIVGNGPLKKSMEKFIRNNSLTEYVTFTGWVNKETILGEYQSAWVFVQTSQYEAMSVAPLEAMACGTYVICTSAGANSDIITAEENGEIFPIADSQELSEKLVAFYNNKFKKGFIADTDIVNKIRTSHDWSHILLKYQELLEKTAIQNN